MHEINHSQLSHLPRGRIVVFGGTGGVGRAFVERALEAGHELVLLARDPARVKPLGPGAEIVQGDVTDYESVLRVVRGASAVVCALGAPALSRSRVRSEGTENIVRAMQACDSKRLICVSVFGASDTREALPFFLRYLLFPIYLRRVVRDHEVQEEIVRASELDWTLVRPPFLTDGPLTGDYAHGFSNDEVDSLSLDISRADVADFMLGQLGDLAYVHRAPGISYRARASV